MLIKSADDRSKRLALLESLQDSPKLDARQRAWARDELVRVRRGIQGERDAAHYLDSYFADGKNYAVIHDLRLADGEDAAQIDHLVIGRTFDFFLLETKNFGGSLRINDLGEFSVRYAGQREYGIPSPLEQSRRHERVLLRTLDKLGISGGPASGPRSTTSNRSRDAWLRTRAKGISSVRRELDTQRVIEASLSDFFNTRKATWRNFAGRSSFVTNSTTGIADR